jgi:dephospho-CoA kinase
MKLVGLTGGIGSGKSTVADVFRTLGIPVYVADQRGKFLMNQDQALKRQIIELLGSNAYLSTGELNNTWIATQVFPDPALLDKLNDLVHPAVARDVAKWARDPAHANAPYLIKESALIFEASLTENLDEIILVVAEAEVRIRRVMQRDQVTREKVEARMHNQWSDEQKIPLADYIIYNDRERSLIGQVKDIDQMLRLS